VKHNMSKDLYQFKKIMFVLGMNYEKIDACEKNCKLFWKEDKDDTECMHYGRSRYMKVINKDGASITTKSGGQIASLHTCHTKAEMVVFVRRNSKTNEVAQGRKI
jgi:hypothetical protein